MSYLPVPIGNSKLSSRKDVLGIDIDTYRRWVEYHFTT